MTAQKKILVVFHSASGNTKKVAEAIAARLGADLEQIRPVKPIDVDIKGKGTDNFLNMGRVVFAGMTKKKAAIEEPVHDPTTYDLVIVGTPVYANTLPAPTRAYLARYKSQFKTTAFFCTGEDPNNQHIFELMEAACEQTPIATLPFHAPDISADAYAGRVAEFVANV